jgi:hypothetical protein
MECVRTPFFFSFNKDLFRVMFRFSKKSNIRNYHNFEKHINSTKSIFGHCETYRNFENLRNYPIFQSKRDFEISDVSVISFVRNLNTADKKLGLNLMYLKLALNKFNSYSQ